MLERGPHRQGRHMVRHFATNRAGNNGTEEAASAISSSATGNPQEV